jgi:steroid delta-isomerase-like uncharacterized protein
MSADASRTAARRFLEEIVNRRDEAAADELLADDVVFHEPPSRGGTRHGREAVKEYLQTLAAAFPDFAMTIEDEFAEGEKAVVRWTSHGTHRGEFHGIAPTGRRFEAPGMDIFHLEDGRIREVWVTVDALGWVQQLGGTPAAGAAR